MAKKTTIDLDWLACEIDHDMKNHQEGPDRIRWNNREMTIMYNMVRERDETIKELKGSIRKNPVPKLISAQEHRCNVNAMIFVKARIREFGEDWARGIAIDQIPPHILEAIEKRGAKAWLENLVG